MNVQYFAVSESGTFRADLSADSREQFLNDKVWLEDVMLHNSSHSREGLSLQEAIAESPNGLLLFCLQFVLRSDGEARFAEKFTWVENGQVLKTETVERDW